MKVPWKWLNDYIDLPWAPEEACERFTQAGVKVEELRCEKLDLSGVVSALVEDVGTHPQRPNLKVGTLNTGRGRFTVVSGAPGLVKGNIVLLAVPGSRIPGGTEIGARDFAGVESQGMVVCSNEVLAGAPHRPEEDIVILPPGTPLGVPAQELLQLDDWVIDFELTVNFSHCLSMLGIALEASAISGNPVRLPKLLERWDWAGPNGSRPPEDDPREEGEWKIDLPDTDLCPRYVGKVVRNLRFGYSPIEVERRLMLAGMRPISALVDATNYVMLETGQPLHAFDADKLSGKTISARRSRKGESILTLDGEERPLAEGTLVIADAEGPVAVAGVMGGARTEVSSETKNVLLESAFFAPIPTRVTSKNLKLRTEAALRFEKTVDPTAQAAVIERAAEFLTSIAGGTSEKGRSDKNLIPQSAKTVAFSTRAVKRTLGDRVSAADCKRVFAALRFGVQPADGGGEHEVVRVTVPPRRVDIAEEIDLVEEVARHYGYHNFEGKPLTPAVPGGPPNRQYVWADKLRDFLVSLGGYEVVTTSLLAPEDLANLGWDASDRRGTGVPLQEPLSSSESILRTSLLPGLLRVISRNQSIRQPGGLFWEIGTVFFPSGEELPHEASQLALASYGTLYEGNWAGEGAEASFFRLKGTVEGLLSRMGIDADFLPGSSMPFHPGKSARVTAGHSMVGEIGEVHPEVLRALGLSGPCVIAWFAMDGLMSCAREVRYRPISRFMPVERDIAVVVGEKTPAADIIRVVKETARDLERVTLFDVYDKPPVPAGKKSLALRLVYQPRERTLTEDELSADRNRIVEALAAKIGGDIRL
jgi:phenylalanyl-tRNA synthetase beta chain